MKAFVVLLSVPLLSALVFAAPRPEAAKKDMDGIQGTWTMIFAATNGQQLPAESIANIKLVMRDDKYTLFKEEDKVNDHGTFKLDAGRSPRTIDITEDQGPNKGKTNRGIYVLDGDTFMVCYNLPHMERPTEFTSRPNASIFLFIYKRDRP
jgi:uncharacterized protein (TIGR03067 family)